MKAKKRSFVYLSIIMAVLFLHSCKENGATSNNLFMYAYFEADNMSVPAGDSVTFSDLSLGNPTAWNWTFEGGTPSTSTEQNPVVVYDTPGQYKVTLEVAGDAETSIKEIDDFISVVSAGFLTDHIVASYSFDGSAKDAGPNGIDATNMNNVTFDGTDRDGNENSAAVFNGSNALIISDDPAFNNIFASDFSIGIWVKTDQTGRMMVWQEAGSDDGHSVNLQGYMRIGDDDAYVHVMLRNDNKIDRLKYFGENASTLSDGNWHHVVTTREGAYSRIYVDGEMKVELSGTTPQINFSSNWDFKLGVQQNIGGGYGNYFTGSLDDLIVYDKALTEQEVADLYNL